MDRWMDGGGRRGREGEGERGRGGMNFVTLRRDKAREERDWHRTGAATSPLHAARDDFFLVHNETRTFAPNSKTKTRITPKKGRAYRAPHIPVAGLMWRRICALVLDLMSTSRRVPI